MHRRSVTLDSPGRRLTVVDTFDAAVAAPLRLSWHLGPDVVVDLDGTNATLSWQVGLDRRQGRLALPEGLTWTRASGRSRSDRGLVFPPLRHSRSGDFSCRARNGHLVNPSRHRTGVTVTKRATDLRSIGATLRRRSRVLHHSRPRGPGPGHCLRVAAPAAADQHHLGAAPHTCARREHNSDVDTQVQIALSATVLERAGQAVVPALSPRSVKDMVEISAPTNQLIQDRGDLRKRGRGTDAVTSRRRFLRRLRQQYCTRGHFRRAGGPQGPEGSTAERRSGNCRMRLPLRPSVSES